ncbi:HAMP domain-containing histidine kinase [Nocardioides sp. zg-578]|uniref:Sensor histidine kinase MtrB n=1 Tax=Nocardioides marmotae TaxID=2663857 RepID=A0A6I3JAN9_9ACTN|nr:MtrAB system histidine kinase MtrB [Nocardioides marmotae]MCR6031446.1 HAMP domain-containing protein [Gordonia jinghuaiqii]MBC9735420.1 HAMP domain-containing histidine kinase [Nocardioides marmotae]MTB86517.1 HAMP domain-containing protein [Nocardioides marmotae]MTB95085.1 HAMP domain-containing protein [Nocardioides marmotae]QKE03608.1 HAMP domain-containing histidine kinase [Nocardioides marmotae]
MGSTVRRGLTFWRRSIQARVVASTLVLSAVVVSVVGWFLLQQTREGLLENRVDAVVAEADNEAAEAVERLVAVPGTETDASTQASELAIPIIARGQTRGFDVVLGGAESGGGGLESAGSVYTPGLDTASVPRSLLDHFAQSSETAWTYAPIRTVAEDGSVSTEPGIVVGAQVRLPSDGQARTLYFLFSLEEERETLALVTRALLTAGGLLLVLVAGMTWLVTRQVVTPIRAARRVAERLAAGRLQERVKVSGEDDLARLALSFNQMASNLQRQIRQLEELSRVQRRFVADVSHELRTPLTTVRMAGDVLYDARDDFDPATARAAELLQTELDRFERLLVDLLEISRFDAGAAVLELEDVNLVDVAHRVVEGTRPLAEQRGVTLVVRAPARPCLAEADVRRVERIVRNLVTNAIDHAGPPERGRSRVVVHVAGDDHAAAIAVRDYGVGLAPGESALVFNRFWRADPARARTSGGTGLGLSISLEDTHLHGGWLQAWGRPDEGAQFRLTLPRRAGTPLRQSPLPLVPADARERLAGATS